MGVLAYMAMGRRALASYVDTSDIQGQWTYGTLSRTPTANQYAGPASASVTYASTSTTGSSHILKLKGMPDLSGVTEWVVQARLRISAPTNVGNMVFGVGDSTDTFALGAPGFGITFEADTLFLRELVDSFTPTAVVSAVNMPVGDYRLISIHGNTSGFIDVYMDGVKVMTGATASVKTLDSIWVRGAIFNSLTYMDLAVFEVGDLTYPDTLDEIFGCTLTSGEPDGNGTYTDWTGSYTAIDEVPPSASDAVTATAVDDRSTFTVDPMVYAHPYLAVIDLRAHIDYDNATAPTGANMEATSRAGATDQDYGTFAMGTGGNVIVNLGDTDANAAPWDTTDLGELGFVVRT